ncbi:hypothetical protein SCHPADRAFT_470807 [Schizopora paradoxa]|uniref:Uncharacterized protein n=1 Tax=Schizopora paradoxa TaxID=27342 RepID=A0A0H2RIM9_9AGAM|nr:hypothetical protein SCHPADRAFT_470807 [Schizopora paradoxa]
MKPAHTAYPFDGRLGDFLMWKTKDDPEKRKFYLKQVVVTKTYKAQSYAQFVSNGQTGKVKCEFKCKVPIPPGNVALSSDQVWETTTQSGTWSLGGYTKDQYSFTPLIELQSLEKKPSCPFVRPFEFTKDLVFESVYKHVRPSAEEDSPNPKEEGTVSYTDFAKDAIALKTQTAANASKPAAQTPDNRPSQGKLSLPIDVSLQVPINIGGGEEDADGDQKANMSDDGGQQEPGVASGGAEPSPQQSEEQPCSGAQAPDGIPTQASSTSPETNGGDDNCADQSPPDDGAGQAPPTEQSCPDDQTTCPAPSESPESGASETDNGGGQSCPSDQGDPTPPADTDNSDCNDQQNDCPPVESPDEEPCDDCPSDMQANLC